MDVFKRLASERAKLTPVIFWGLHRFRWYIAIALPALVLFSVRFFVANWFLEQGTLTVRSLWTPPATRAQWQDPNFWTGNLLGSALVIGLTWWALTDRSWQGWLLERVFVDSEVQKAIFRLLCMRALEDALFLFTMRQVVVLMSWAVVPPAFAAQVGHLGWLSYMRHFVDSKAAVLLYLTTSLMWYGLSIGLYQRPLDKAGHRFVSALARTAVYLGVAVLRVYPLLNSRGVTFLQCVLALSTRFPLAAAALGAAAVEPAEAFGRYIRYRYGTNSLLPIAAINAVNVLSMLWTSAAGCTMAKLILQSYAEAAASSSSSSTTPTSMSWQDAINYWDASQVAHPDTAVGWPPYSVMTELAGLAVLLAACGTVLLAFLHALATLYAAAPLFQLIPVAAPLVESVAFIDGGVVVDKLFALFRDHLGALWEAQALSQVPSAHEPRGVSDPAAEPDSVGRAGSVPVPLQPDTTSTAPAAPVTSSMLSAASTFLSGAAAAVASAFPLAANAVAPARGAATSATLNSLGGRVANPFDPSSNANTLPADIAVAEKVVWAVGGIIDLSLALQKAVSSQGFGILVRAKVRVLNTTGRPMALQRTVFKLQVGASPVNPLAQSRGGSAGPVKVGDYSTARPEDVPTVITAVVDPICVPGPDEVRRAAAAAAAQHQPVTAPHTVLDPTHSAAPAPAPAFIREASTSAMSTDRSSSDAPSPFVCVPPVTDECDPIAEPVPKDFTGPRLRRHAMPSADHMSSPPPFVPNEDSLSSAAFVDATSSVASGSVDGSAYAEDAFAQQLGNADHAAAEAAATAGWVAAADSAMGRLGRVMSTAWFLLWSKLAGGQDGGGAQSTHQSLADAWAALLSPAPLPAAPALEHPVTLAQDDGATDALRRQWSSARCEPNGAVEVDVHVTFKLHVYFDSLFSLLMRLRNGDTISSVLSHVYMASHVSPSFVFSLPVLTYWNRDWAGVGVLDRVKSRGASMHSSQVHARLVSLVADLETRRIQGLAHEVSHVLEGLPPQIRSQLCQVLRIIARVNMRGNVRLAEDAFRAYTAAAAGPAARSSAAEGSLLGSRRFQDEASAFAAVDAEDRAGPGSGSGWVSVSNPGTSTATGPAAEVPPPPRDAPLLRHASSAPHRNSGPDTDAGLSGAATVIALMQALYLLIAMHREMRLRQLSGHRLVPVLAELAHTVTLMAYDHLAAAWQGPGGRRDPFQLLVLTGGMMSLQAVLFRDGFAVMVRAPPAPPNAAVRHAVNALVRPVQ